MLSGFESCLAEPYNSLPYIYMYLIFCVAVAWDLFREWRFRNYERLGYTIYWYNCGLVMCDYCPHEGYKMGPLRAP